MWNRYKDCEFADGDVPEELKNTGVTILDGPFFSIMPFPSTNFHSLSHVRYTPHFDWYDNSFSNSQFMDIEYYKKIEKSAYIKMIQDAKRYMPILSRCIHRESLWATKTILPSSEVNDSRPILFKENNGINGYHCIVGGKIDNIYDAISIVKKMRITSGK